MTRDEAIEVINGPGGLGPDLPPYTWASSLIDRLAALGVLKLDEMPSISVRDMPEYDGSVEPMTSIVHPVSVSEEAAKRIFGRSVHASEWSGKPKAKPDTGPRIPAIIRIETTDRDLLAAMEEWTKHDVRDPIEAFGRKWHITKLAIEGTFVATLQEHVETAEPRMDPWKAVQDYLDGIGVRWDQAGPGHIVLHGPLTEAQRTTLDEIRPPSLLVGETIRCEPPPEHRSNRYHWIECVLSSKGDKSLFIGRWDMNSWWFAGREGNLTVNLATERGWRYVAPCEEPPVPAE